MLDFGLEQTVLMYCNRVRRDLGLEPVVALLPGLPRNECECPLARTIRQGGRQMTVSIDQNVVAVDVDGEDVLVEEVPDVVAKWINKFDSSRPGVDTLDLS